MNKPLFPFLANTMRGRIIPHYQHFLKDPLWPRFLTHSAVLLTDSWPQTRRKSRAHSFVFPGALLWWRPLSLLEHVWQLSSSSPWPQGLYFPGVLFPQKLESTGGSLWPLPTFMPEGQILGYEEPLTCPLQYSNTEHRPLTPQPPLQSRSALGRFPLRYGAFSSTDLLGQQPTCSVGRIFQKAPHEAAEPSRKLFSSQLTSTPQKWLSLEVTWVYGTFTVIFTGFSTQVSPNKILTVFRIVGWCLQTTVPAAMENCTTFSQKIKNRIHIIKQWYLWVYAQKKSKI